jgi:DNA-binding NtrC family response regulator
MGVVVAWCEPAVYARRCSFTVRIPHLVRHFMARVAGGKGGAPRINAISEGALAMLQAYDWPGNIRQLENAVFRAAVLCEGDLLTEEEFPQIRAQVDGTVDLDRDEPRPTSPPANAEPSIQAGIRPAGLLKALDERGNVRSLADMEVEMIRLAIERYHGQMSEVARRLGIGRSTLYRKLKEHGIDPEEGRPERLAS